MPCSVCYGLVCGWCGIDALRRCQGRVITLADSLVLCCFLAMIIAQLKEGQGLETTPALLMASCASLAAIIRKAGEIREGVHPCVSPADFGVLPAVIDAGTAIAQNRS